MDANEDDINTKSVLLLLGLLLWGGSHRERRGHKEEIEGLREGGGLASVRRSATYEFSRGCQPTEIISSYQCVAARRLMVAEFFFFRYLEL